MNELTAEDRRLKTKWMPKCGCGNILSIARVEQGKDCCPACDFKMPDSEATLLQIIEIDAMRSPASGPASPSYLKVMDIVRNWQRQRAAHLNYLTTRRPRHASKQAKQA